MEMEMGFQTHDDDNDALTRELLRIMSINFSKQMYQVDNNNWITLIIADWVSLALILDYLLRNTCMSYDNAPRKWGKNVLHKLEVYSALIEVAEQIYKSRHYEVYCRPQTVYGAG